MKPVRLTMQALGPYAGREVVDFRDAVDAGLFGIYGQTGAGKSTIFSAMTFALFGEAAKSEQDSASLRSDHADPALPTEVEFVFDLAGRRYVVRRRPEQMRPKQRGNGETRDPHEAFLFDATGLGVEEIADGSPGKILAEKKVGLVREAVTELLGYGAEQFRQIVLLPQGKFETFLSAKTEARLAILRELFDVSRYHRLAARMKDDAIAAERRVRREREVCAGRLAAEDLESMEGLAAAIAAAEAAHAEEGARERTAIAAAEAAGEARAAAHRLAEAFKAAETARTDLAALEARADEMEALKTRSEGATRAAAALDVERYLAEARTEVTNAEADARAKAEAARRAAEAATNAAGILATHEGAAAETEAMREKVRELEGFERTLAASEAIAAEVKDAETAEAEAVRASEGAERAVADLVVRRDRTEADLARARTVEGERAQLTAAHQASMAAFAAAEGYEKAERAATTARKAAEDARVAQDQAARARDIARIARDEAEEKVAQAQALQLAGRLAEGAPCPVCGSEHHPAPATGHMENAGLAAHVRTARQTFDQAQDAYQRVAAEFAAAEGLMRARAEGLAELAPPARPVAALRTERDNLGRAIEALGSPTDLAAAEGQLAELKASLAAAEATRETLREPLAAARSRLAEARGRLAQALSTVPEPLRTRQTLATALASARQTLATRLAAIESARAEATRTHEAALGACKDAEGAAEILARAVERRSRAETAFTARLAEIGLDAATFAMHKPAIATLEADRATLAEHARKLERAREHAGETAAAVADIERPDLDAVERALGEAIALRDAVTRERARKGARCEHLARLRAELEETAARLARVEEETAPLRELAALFNAQNGQKLDLETFAIGAMFDEVLAAANQRLTPMTSGRYTLEREVEFAGGRSRTGLGIRVFDIYTGKSRATATLSGGETFIAALALALGLSDVVESTSGKVRLDTIFIDEGFGSLDAQDEAGTLDQVLEVLANLTRETRAIGLISHVPQVQEAIPNGFYVRPRGTTGSRVETRTLS